MLTFDVARTHNLIQLREPITLTVDTSRLVAALSFLPRSGAERTMCRAWLSPGRLHVGSDDARLSVRGQSAWREPGTATVSPADLQWWSLTIRRCGPIGVSETRDG
jgi:hypothetical protein